MAAEVDAVAMTTSVIHPPRVAWDLARTTVEMARASSAEYQWFAGQLELCLGGPARRELGETRWRLIADERVDGRQVELGRWRVRLEGAMAEDPRRSTELAALRLEAEARLAAAI